jgi:hypothetical protein
MLELKMNLPGASGIRMLHKAMTLRGRAVMQLPDP